MPTIWGILDQMQTHGTGGQWVQIKTILSGGITVHIRALVGDRTTVARGTERIHASTLRTGEPVELTYHDGRDGFMEAETVYVHSDEDIATGSHSRDKE
ncbi:MAG TPA: hypothetical protein VFS39_11175 [Nitrospira sp.]|nr:hypothetical protein [Nitrospira sp.]